MALDLAAASDEIEAGVNFGTLGMVQLSHATAGWIILGSAVVCVHLLDYVARRRCAATRASNLCTLFRSLTR